MLIPNFNSAVRAAASVEKGRHTVAMVASLVPACKTSRLPMEHVVHFIGIRSVAHGREALAVRIF